MAIARDVLLLLHLVGFAALFGGSLVQVRSRHPEVSAMMLSGAWLELVSGAALVVFLVLRHDELHYPENAVKLALTLLLLLLVAKNRRFQTIPRGLLVLIGTLTLVTAGLSVLWH